MGASASNPPPVPASGVVLGGMQNGKMVYKVVNTPAGTSITNVAWPGVTVMYVAIAAGYTMSITGSNAANGQAVVYQGGGPGVIATGVAGINGIAITLANAARERLQAYSSYMPPNLAAARARGYTGSERLQSYSSYMPPNLAAARARGYTGSEGFSVQGAYQGLVHQMHELAPGNMTGDAPTSRGGMM
jgi:hypothetical protein